MAHSEDGFGGRYGGWGAPHIPPEQTPPDRDRMPLHDPDDDYAAGDVNGDYVHRFYSRYEGRSFHLWIEHRWREEFEAWRRNNPKGLPEVAPPQSIMAHAPPETALAQIGINRVHDR